MLEYCFGSRHVCWRASAVTSPSTGWLGQPPEEHWWLSRLVGGARGCSMRNPTRSPRVTAELGHGDDTTSRPSSRTSVTMICSASSADPRSSSTSPSPSRPVRTPRRRTFEIVGEDQRRNRSCEHSVAGVAFAGSATGAVPGISFSSGWIVQSSLPAFRLGVVPTSWYGTGVTNPRPTDAGAQRCNEGRQAARRCHAGWASAGLEPRKPPAQRQSVGVTLRLHRSPRQSSCRMPNTPLPTRVKRLSGCRFGRR